ncbi:MAG TPA: hypothetical protein VIS96_09510 [Terrimicrobiaceae bacterium]
MGLFSPVGQFEQLSFRLKEGRRRLHRELDYYPKLLHTLTNLPDTGQHLREVLITSCEINDRHGTGLLLSRLFSENAAFNIHARSFYGTGGRFAAVEIANEGPGDQFASFILREIAGLMRIEHILVVPYMSDDAHTAIAIREAAKASLATWVMDDQTVFSNQFPKPLLEELFERSDIRFVISPEMKQEYQEVFGVPFFVLPPTVPQKLLSNAREMPQSNAEGKCCALIGNVWSASWLARLERLIEKSGWKVNWYGHDAGKNGEKPGFINRGFVSEIKLGEGLAEMPFVIAPTGTGDGEDDSIHLTKLSLPSRIPYLLAVHRVPILVVGSPESCAARFVRRLGVGLHCAYNPQEFEQAAQRLCDPYFNSRCRANCAHHAALFSDEGLASWIWKSAQAGTPIDSRFAIFDS